MDLNVGIELATLNRMSVDALQARYSDGNHYDCPTASIFRPIFHAPDCRDRPA